MSPIINTILGITHVSVLYQLNNVSIKDSINRNTMTRHYSVTHNNDIGLASYYG